MKPRAGQNQIRSPCPRALRAPARPHVRLSDTPRTGRAAEDVGPYHPSCPDAARRAKDPRRPRRGTSGGVCGGGVKPRAGQNQNLSPCPRALRVNHTRRRYDR